MSSSLPTMPAREIQLSLPQLTLTAKIWGTGGIPLLALHGWLDNAATFDHLAPKLSGVQLVAMDMPGHGLSDHRPPGVMYHFIDWIHDVVEAVDALGWGEFSLLGHSMGAGIATCVAGVLRDRIRHVILIEGLGPLSHPAHQAAVNLRTSIQHWKVKQQTSPRIYSSFDKAVRTRQVASKMNPQSVQTLVQRGLKAVDGGFSWRSDPRLMIKSRLYLSEDHVRAFIKDIVAPVLLFQASETQNHRWYEVMRERLGLIKNLQHIVLPGYHHLHLDTPEPIAQAIMSFLKENPA